MRRIDIHCLLCMWVVWGLAGCATGEVVESGCKKVDGVTVASSVSGVWPGYKERHGKPDEGQRVADPAVIASVRGAKKLIPLPMRPSTATHAVMAYVAVVEDGAIGGDGCAEQRGYLVIYGGWDGRQELGIFGPLKWR